MGPQFEDRKTFAVPVTPGNYAPEEIVFASANASVPSPGLSAVTALLETLGVATGAVIELWLLKVGGVVATAGDWFNSGDAISAVGASTWPLANWRGAKIRAKSAGTAGSVVVSATSD